MITDKRILALIPARGGSKGIPRKNIREVAGKPLIGWTIEAAKKSKMIDRLILSTDDPQIAEVAVTLGCEVPFMRPKEMARDDTPGIVPVLHALEIIDGYDYIVLLQPTSPLRTDKDIDGCIEYCFSHHAPACVSVSVPEKSPYLMYTLGEGGEMVPVMESEPFVSSRRQDLNQVYSLNGAVYIADCNWLKKKKTFLTEETLAYVMPDERSVDIDVELDLIIADTLLKHANHLKLDLV